MVRWLTKVAHALRTRDLPVSSAHVIEAVRLAETLATLRNRPLAGLAEVTEATRSVLCDGDELAVRFVTDHLVVGQALGSVNDGVPTVPLEADLTRTCRTLRIRREAQPRLHDLDLRRSIDQARSQLFHRLRLLDLDWIMPAESSVESQGTFRETWQSAWEPEYSVAVVEAAVWGTTVASAASARVESIMRSGTLVELTRAVERCLLADLPQTLSELLQTLAEPGRPGRRRHPPDGRPSGPGPGAALRRCPPHRHHGPAAGQCGAGGAHLRRSAAGGVRTGRGQRGSDAATHRCRQRCDRAVR